MNLPISPSIRGDGADIYDRAFARFDFGYAAAAAMVLLAFTSVLVYLQLQNWTQE